VPDAGDEVKRPHEARSGVAPGGSGAGAPIADGLALSRLSRREDPLLPALEVIARECFPESTFSVEEELGRPWARVWSACPAEGAAPAGFLVAWHVADELHVLNVATTPPLRRRGIARALMDHALAYAASERVRIVLLEVRRSNRAAIKLYRDLGFTALGVRVAYYADNQEDAVEMLLALDPESGRALPGHDEIRIDG
jgi:[ribosomal protein S18]-alanine N-acetyltransferase